MSILKGLEAIHKRPGENAVNSGAKPLKSDNDIFEKRIASCVKHGHSKKNLAAEYNISILEIDRIIAKYND